MNNTDSNVPVEQLWYTWSDVGVSTMHAGFHIRAASSGLTEIYSDRVRNIDRTMRYVLPPGTDRFAITPDQAPVGLTFARSEWNNEYLLVHKKYTGTDIAGRLGNFFIHALALGEHSKDFTAEDAIWLWESPLWKTDSKELDDKDRRNTRLNTLSIEQVHESAGRFRTTQFQQVRNALQFIIAAYLMRKDRTTPLYIAAPASEEVQIASIIAGLTSCLPAQLLINLTFSTYEPDVTKAKTELVGTSWIAMPGKEKQAEIVFPKRLYVEGLAVNCSTQETSNLQSHPQIEYNQLAVSFAEFAAESLATGNLDQLSALRDYAEQSRALNSASFLQIYNTEIVNTVSMSEVEIERYLTSDMRTAWLYRKNSRKKVLDRATENLAWGDKRLHEILLALRGQAQKEYTTTAQRGNRSNTLSLAEEPKQTESSSSHEIQPRRGRRRGPVHARRAEATLTEALALLATSAISEVMKHMEQGSRFSGAIERKKAVNTIILLLKLMDSCVLPQDPTEVWKLLFEAIVESKQATTFLHSTWIIHRWLLRGWNNILPSDSKDDDRMRPLLIISWNHLGEFLKLGLHDRHKQWIIFAIQELVPNPIPRPQLALDLEQHHAREINMILAIFAQEQQYNIEAYLIIRLVEQGYPIAAGLEAYIEPLLVSLNRDNYLLRSAKDFILTLTRIGYLGSPSYMQQVIVTTRNVIAATPTTGQEMIDLLIQHNFPVRTWMIDLLVAEKSNRTDVLHVLNYVYPTPAEQATFFVQDGPHYLKAGSPSLKREHWIQPMVALYEQLLLLEGKLERLFILLDAIDVPEEIVHVLTSTSLEGQDMEHFLTRYGPAYLQDFQQWPQPASIIVTNFTQLINSGYPYGPDLLFKIMPAQLDEKHLASLLAAAKLTPDQQARFLEQFGVHYLTLYPTIPLLMEYIGTYTTNIHRGMQDKERKRTSFIALLQQQKQKAFFAFLLQQQKNLALDPTTQTRIQSWQAIDDYFASPTADAQTLETLAQAISALALPDIRTFSTNLAEKVVSCIKTEADLSTLIKAMREVPKLAKEQANEQEFLITVAAYAAEDYRKNKRLEALHPYLLFILNIPEQSGTEYFLYSFLERLLYPITQISPGSIIAVSPDLPMLSTFIEQQYEPTSLAVKRWHAYLERITLRNTLRQEESPTPTQTLLTWFKRATKRRGI